MSPSDERLRAAVLAQLTPDEIRSCVVYLVSRPLVGGTMLTFARHTIEMPWDGFLAFVDLDPMANWTHRCRYVSIEPETGETRSVDAEYPPFGARAPGQSPMPWRVLYRAPDVPAAVLAVPERSVEPDLDTD